MYIQTLVRDSEIKDAVYSQVAKAALEGYKVIYAAAEVQRNLFNSQEDIFVSLEVEKNAR